MKAGGLYYYRCVVQDPLFPCPKDAKYLSQAKGFAGYQTPKGNKTLVFYGTVKEFDQYLKTRKRPAVDRSDMHNMKGRPNNV